MSLDSMAAHSAELFAKCFGHAPRWLVAAPGRVNLIGEHTDYNDGFVLPMAIERYTVIAADRTDDRHVTLHSMTTGETARFSLRPWVEPGEPAWSNYVRGVIAGFQRRKQQVPGFNAVIDSTVPFGGGLSSSAALEVAAATMLEAITHRPLDPIDKALLCQKAEHDFAGVPCGIMDQFTSVLGQKNHALLLDCRSRTTTPVAIPESDVTVLIINTTVRRKLADGEYAKRRSQCEAAARALRVPALRDADDETLSSGRSGMDATVFRRARHVISENERTQCAAKAIQSRDWPAVGELMYASHASLRDDYEVSSKELEIVVEIARSIGERGGMFGCRMTGAGFGGSAVSLVKTEAASTIAKRIDEAYEKTTGHQAAIFSSRPAGGARIMK
jgi:galactokinase